MQIRGQAAMVYPVGRPMAAMNMASAVSIGCGGCFEQPPQLKKKIRVASTVDRPRKLSKCLQDVNTKGVELRGHGQLKEKYNAGGVWAVGMICSARASELLDFG
ncbi:hypothetical protein B0T21DRAFT_448822 [Apiosordaria backusii]|uniref:Uncharacterized protein n=1 Tax=Apiosordaria backusii TaxID=314023 RepID=A0AA40K133_9PEZI|nr:hypothetical protein B0T21DRAFT_448822 [Apiosordaria backusii]